MIIQTVDQMTFINAFADAGHAENFTIEARSELFDYYDDLSDSMGTPFELDVIAICVDWSEYTKEELKAEYDWASYADNGLDFDDFLSDLDADATILATDVDTFLVLNY